MSFAALLGKTEHTVFMKKNLLPAIPWNTVYKIDFLSKAIQNIVKK
jgi:hypothetical protein